MTIEEIRDFDDEIFEAIKENFHNSLDTFSKAGFPNVGRALMTFFGKINFIKNAIFDICENDDIYSANILLRSLIEHHLKFMFIFIRHSKEQNDDVGIEYYEFCDFSESIMIGKSWLESRQMFTPENEKKLYETILEKKPEFKKYSPNEIIQKTKQFNYRNIVSYIKNSIKGEKLRYGWLDMIIPNYGDLSSYVHGGPLADKYVLHFSKDDEREKELINICRLTFLTANSLKQFHYLLLSQLDQEQYSETLTKIDSVLKKFNKTS